MRIDSLTRRMQTLLRISAHYAGGHPLASGPHSLDGHSAGPSAPTGGPPCRPYRRTDNTIGRNLPWPPPRATVSATPAATGGEFGAHGGEGTGLASLDGTH